MPTYWHHLPVFVLAWFLYLIERKVFFEKFPREEMNQKINRAHLSGLLHVAFPKWNFSY